MKPAPFGFRAATSIDEVVDALAEVGDEGKLIAGGQSLLPAMAFRLVRPAELIDVNGVGGLDHLTPAGEELRVGALVRHAALEHAPLDAPWRVLRDAVRHVGHWPIRVRGTFGGSIAHADPSAELAVAAVALDATIHVRSRSGERAIAAADFFVAPYLTTLAADELVTEVVLRAPSSARAAFLEFSPRAGDFAFASVCVVAGDGYVRVALGSVGPTPLRATAAERILAEGGPPEEAAREAARDADPSDDMHATAAYRRQLVEVLTLRALRELAA
jgi:CO/xanthine dehydrogenase FAD-binding subunit